MLVDAGFADVRVVEKAESREFIKDWLPGSGAEDFVVSANVTATKPKPSVGERIANTTSDDSCCGPAKQTPPASPDAALAAGREPPTSLDHAAAPLGRGVQVPSHRSGRRR